MFHVFQVVSLVLSRNFSKFQNLHREVARNFSIQRRRKFGIFPSPKAYIEKGRSEFFQVQSLGKARNFSKSQGLHRGGASKFFKVPERNMILGV
mgnify:CR=1 FL=1